MERNRTIYYIFFPLVTAVLCGFSYYLGLSRGKQIEVTAPQALPTTQDKKEPHEIGQELTFFKTLKSVDNGVAQDPVSEPKPAGTLAVQVNAFKDVGKAHELVDQLKNHGYQAFTKFEKSGWHKVYVGPYTDKEQAAKTAKELAAKGFGRGFVASIK